MCLWKNMSPHFCWKLWTSRKSTGMQGWAADHSAGVLCSGSWWFGCGPGFPTPGSGCQIPAIRALSGQYRYVGIRFGG